MAESATPTYVGQDLLRREDDWLLRGKGRFVDDLPVPRGTLHLGLVLSSQAHARIAAIDATAARALPGVVDVLTGEDFKALSKPLVTEIGIPGYKTNARPVVAHGKVRFVGETVAVVVAESPYIAQDAIELVEVQYETLPVVVDIEASRRPGAPLVHDELGDNIFYHGSFKTEDFDAVFAGADRVIRETFRSRRVAGVPLEPRGCLAVPEPIAAGDSVTLYTSSQVPHIARTAIATFLDMPEARIRVVVPEVGGGFGTKAHVYPEELITVALARRYDTAVKWIQDRREELLTNIHARNHVYNLEAAIDREGVIQAVRLELLTDAGAYSSYPFGCTLEPTGGARMLPGPYRIRNYAYDTYAIATHTCPSGAYRGVAQPTCFMAIEGMMDRIGRELGIDPADVRRRNLVTPAEMPYVNVVGVRYDTGSYLPSLERALANIGYDAFRAEQKAAGGVWADGKRRGVGICCFTEISGTGAPGWRARGLTRLPGFDSALIKVEPTGQVTAYISHARSGQGHLTTFAQILADAVGADIGQVTVIEGDTASTPYGTNTFASRSAVTGGGAVIRAGAKVAAKMRRIAAELLEAGEADIRLEKGRAFVEGVPQLGVSFKQIAETAYSMNDRKLPAGEEYGLEANDFYDPPLATMANAVHAAIVAVDPADGTIAIERYVVVHDCGRIINPSIVDGQIHGGTAQGIGQALMEEIVYDDQGQLLNASLLDYLLPTALDVPDMALDHIESPSIDAVGGFKGVGEGGVIGAVPAITNAVADALAPLGVNVRELPLKPSRIVGLIADAQHR